MFSFAHTSVGRFKIDKDNRSRDGPSCCCSWRCQSIIKYKIKKVPYAPVIALGNIWGCCTYLNVSKMLVTKRSEVRLDVQMLNRRISVKPRVTSILAVQLLTQLLLKGGSTIPRSAY